MKTVLAGVDRAVKSIKDGLEALIQVQRELEGVDEQMVPDPLPDDTSMRSKREWAEEFKKMAEGYVMAKKNKREHLVMLREMVDRAIQDFDKMVALE